MTRHPWNRGLDIGAQLVLKMCGGEASEKLVVGEIPTPDLQIEFPVSETKRLTSIDVSSAETADILTRLGFGVSGTGETLNVKVPGNRPDVHGKADLVEEVMRIHGINNIEPQPLPAMSAVGQKILTTGQLRTRNSRRSPCCARHE